MRARNSTGKRRPAPTMMVDGCKIRMLTPRAIKAFREGIQTPPYTKPIRLEVK